MPFGITLDSTGETPATYFPADDHPDTSFDEILDLVAEELDRRIADDDVCAAAVVCTMESGDRTGFAVQVDTPEETILLIYPYRQTKAGVKISEPEQADGQLISGLFDL